jgi:hypothetical protein
MAIRLFVDRVSLIAPGAVYDVRLKAGVNVIAGPISTGKSSILALIDYALGSSTRPTYPEISKCSDVLVQFRVGSEPLTVQRSLHAINRKARIYEGTIDEVLGDRLEGEEVSAAHDPTAKSVSKEFLRRLGLDNIQVKTAPTQTASDVSTFSLRDLMHFLYVDQDRVDSQRSAFFESHFPVAIKWRQAFEVIAGLYDEISTALSASLKDAQADVTQHKQYLESVHLFLTRSKVPTADRLRRDLDQVASEGARLDQRVNDAREATESRRGEHLELARKRDQLASQRDEILAREAELARSLRQLGRLRVQYERERTQLEFLKESELLVGSLPVSRCPACLQPTPVAANASQPDCHVCHRAIPESAAGVDVDRRLASLKRRVVDLESYIQDLESLQQGLASQRTALADEIADVDSAIRRLQPASIFPEMRELMQLEAAINLNESRRKRLLEHLAFRERAEAEASVIAALEARAAQLTRDLEERQRHRPSRDQVVAALSEHFRSVLSQIRFPDMTGARIDPRNYTPVVREQAYGELFSRGAIALAVTGWHLALLQYFLESPGQFPLFLMIDSPLSNVGHDAADAEFRDQKIVEAFYALLARLHAEHGSEFQMLICDNRPPASGASLISVQFTGDATKGRFGLIADEHQPTPDQAPPAQQPEPPQDQ